MAVGDSCYWGNYNEWIASNAVSKIDPRALCLDGTLYQCCIWGCTWHTFCNGLYTVAHNEVVGSWTCKCRDPYNWPNEQRWCRCFDTTTCNPANNGMKCGGCDYTAYVATISETCNGLDDNCNGQIDEGNVCCSDECANGETGCSDDNTRWDCQMQGDGCYDKINIQCSGLDSYCLDGICVECRNDAECPDDGNDCTDQRCDLSTNTCYLVNNTGSCEDGLFCTVNDKCSQGKCESGTPRVCPEDDEACTTAYCYEATDECLFDTLDCDCYSDEDCSQIENPCISSSCINNSCKNTYPNISCDDNDNCTINDKCKQGECIGDAVDVDDGNPLTWDKCLADGSIIHENVVEGENYDYPESGQQDGEDTQDSTEDQDASQGTVVEQDSTLLWISLILIIIGVGVVGFIIYYKFLKKKTPSKSLQKPVRRPIKKQPYHKIR